MNSRLRAALEGLSRRNDPAFQRARAFPIATRTFSVQRHKDTLKKRDRARRKKFIRPEHAREILEALPAGAADRLHAITCGDFVFCDLIEAIARKWAPVRLHISTLSMSANNVAALERLVAEGCVESLVFVISHYFRGTSKEIFAAFLRDLGSKPGCKIHVARSHSKVTLIRGRRRALVIEGSANLRSSGNFEQLSIFADPELYAFHARWFDDVVALLSE